MNTASKRTDANNGLPTVIVAKTRDEAEVQIKLGKSFKAPSNVSPFNRNMLDFYISKYNYKKSKYGRGIDLYEPIL